MTSTFSPLAAFRAACDANYGLIRKLEVSRLGGNDPRVYVAVADPCDTTPIMGFAASNRGAACSITRERAIIRACGESIERYCSAIFEPAEFLYTSERRLGEENQCFISVRSLYPYAEAQFANTAFPFRPVLPETPVRWVPGITLGGDRCWIPAGCVFVPYRFDATVEPFTHMPISTGLAAGPTVEGCIEKGLAEILERDALMIAWYHRIAVPRLDVASCRGLDSEIDALLDAAAPTGGKWYLSLLTMDVPIPVISAALIDDDTVLPSTSFGIAASINPLQALRNALEEALLTRVLLNRSRELRSRASSEGKPIRTLRDHLLVHAMSPQLRERSSFLLSDGPLLSFARMLEQRRWHDGTVAAHLLAAGLDAAWTEVTTDDVRELGIHVVRTVIPGAQPLDNDHQFRYLGGCRLTSVPRALGLPETPSAGWNEDPHPFP